MSWLEPRVNLLFRRQADGSMAFYPRFFPVFFSTRGYVVPSRDVELGLRRIVTWSVCVEIVFAIVLGVAIEWYRFSDGNVRQSPILTVLISLTTMLAIAKMWLHWTIRRSVRILSPTAQPLTACEKFRLSESVQAYFFRFGAAACFVLSAVFVIHRRFDEEFFAVLALGAICLVWPVVLPFRHRFLRFRHPVLLMGAGLALASVPAAWWLMHSARLQFQGSIREGMSAAEVIAAVGEPARVMEPGETIPKWGNAMPGTAASETWVYYVVPQSQHRFLLTFRDGRLAHYERQQN